MTLAELEQVRAKAINGAVPLFDKVTGAVLVAAELVRTELDTVANHANRFRWAKEAFGDPVRKANELWPAILAANAGATQVAVLGATDASINTNVQAAINLFAVDPPATVP